MSKSKPIEGVHPWEVVFAVAQVGSVVGHLAEVLGHHVAVSDHLWVFEEALGDRHAGSVAQGFVVVDEVGGNQLLLTSVSD